MPTHTVSLNLPESLYTRLQQTAQATHRSLDDLLLYTIKVGSPPRWDDVPVEFQTDLAALDHLDDQSLWKIARSQQRAKEQERYEQLLEKKANGGLSAKEELELGGARSKANRFMLRKAHAAALLRWRGHLIPPAAER